MEFILEVLLQFCGEFFIQLIVELLTQLGLDALEMPAERRRKPVLAALGFAILGAVAGALSLLVFPHSPIANLQLRQANLFVTPLAVGGIMMLIGRWKEARGHDVVRLDRFGYAFVFAFAMALARYIGVP